MPEGHRLPVAVEGGDMHLKYFGDSYDIVKRFLLATLGDSGRWSVQPMFVEKVDSEDAKRFATFIGARLCGKTSVATVAGRTEAMASSKTAEHLFLDPDTGVKLVPMPKTPSSAHLYGAEVIDLVNARPAFLSRPPAAAQHETEVVWRGRDHGFAYESHASFLFLSRDQDLLQRSRSALLGAGVPAVRLVAAR